MSMHAPDLFEYTALSKSEDHIRLIRLLDSHDGGIRCELQHFALSSTPTYSALSYMWGNPAKIRPIALNGTQLHVTTSLETFLQEVACRRKLAASTAATTWPSGWLWIDAVCINQNDLAERSEQVAKMKEIYVNAHSLIVWLGEARAGTYRAMSLLRKIATLEAGEPVSSGEEEHDTASRPSSAESSINTSHEELSALSELLNSPYWNRAWILQEASTPKGSESDNDEDGDAWVCSGSESLGWEQFAKANNKLIQASWDNPLRQLIDLHNVSNTNIATVKYIEERRVRGSFQNPLYPMLVRTRTSEATDPRDKLYAVLGLVDERDHEGLRPDYTLSVEEVYTRLARIIISLSESLDCLGSAGTERNHQVPSWVPDWTVHHDRVPQPFYQTEQLWDRETGQISSRSNIFNASGGMTPDTTFHNSGARLVARGLLFDSVERVSMERPWPDAMPEERWQDWTSIAFADDAGYVSGCTRAEAFGTVLTADFADVWGDWSAERGRTIEGLSDPSLNVFELHDGIVDAMTWHRRLFVTTKGYLGIAPAAMQPGDAVCILFGSQMPMVLREEGDHWLFLGQAYVHGIMDGEAVNGADTEKHSRLFDID